MQSQNASRVLRVGATCAAQRAGWVLGQDARASCAHTHRRTHMRTCAHACTHAATRAGEAKCGSEQAKATRIRADSSMPVDTRMAGGGPPVPSEAISTVIEPIATRLSSIDLLVCGV